MPATPSIVHHRQRTEEGVSPKKYNKWSIIIIIHVVGQSRLKRKSRVKYQLKQNTSTRNWKTSPPCTWQNHC